MALLDFTEPDRDMRSASALAPHTQPEEREARRALAQQIARLERDLGDVQVSSFPHGGGEIGSVIALSLRRGPRLLGLAELELLRDDLAEQVRTARRALEARGREQEEHRVRLERMLLAPGKHKFEKVSNKELGEGGCGVWQVRPRLGVIGMFAGWWHVKLSSGCPLATARRLAPGSTACTADGKAKPQANRAPRPGCSFSGPCRRRGACRRRPPARR